MDLLYVAVLICLYSGLSIKLNKQNEDIAVWLGTVLYFHDMFFMFFILS